MRPLPKWLLWSSSAVTGVTGAAYWWMKHRMIPTDSWAAINHPLQPWMLKAHIVAAPVLVFAVGLVATDHIWRNLGQGVMAGRRSGLLAVWVLAPMVLSGYLIQAVTSHGWLQALTWTHVTTGVLYLLGMVLHLRVFRRRYSPRSATMGSRREALRAGR